VGSSAASTKATLGFTSAIWRAWSSSVSVVLV
jgi:hypothetical protein